MYLETDFTLRLLFLFFYSALCSYFVISILKLKQSFLLGLIVSLTLLIQFYSGEAIFSLWAPLSVILATIFLKFKINFMLITPVLIAFALFSSKILIPHFFYFELISWRTFFSDVGIINTINQLRGEENYSFLSKLFYNKSLYVYIFLGNLLKGIDLTNLSSNLFLGNFTFLVIGIYKYFKSFSKEKKLVLVWLIAGTLPLGIIRTDLKEPFVFLLPALLYLLLLGIGKNKIILLTYFLFILLDLLTHVLMRI